MARQRGNRWQADVLVDGARKRVSFATEAEAVAYEEAVAGGYKPSDTNNLGDYVDQHFDNRKLWGEARSANYIRGNWRVIYRYIPASTPLDKITAASIERMIEGMRRDGKQGGTINRKVANVAKLLKFAFRNKHIMQLPDLSHRQSEKGTARERVLSREEERATMLFFQHIGKPVAAHLVTFLLYTGCRMGEALSLDRKHVAGRSITFHHSKVKNGQTRTIPMVPQAAEAWEAVCKLSNSPTPFGALMPYYTFRDHWAALKGHLKVTDDEFVPHMLRHTCATRLVIAGVPLPHVMKWLGHKSIQVTMRYTNLVPHDLDVAARALEAA